VGAYVKARDAEGARSAAREHKQAYPHVPLAVRDLLALAVYCERQQQYQEAASRYEEAITAAPDDPLVPKALVAYARLLHQQFSSPQDAVVVLERVAAHPKATPEILRAGQDLLAQARAAAGAAAAAGQPPEPALHVLPDEPSAEMPGGKGAETVAAPAGAEPSIEMPAMESAGSGAAPPAPGPAVETPGVDTAEAAGLELVVEAAAPMPTRLAPVAARAVGIDARGLTLQDGRGGKGHLPWQRVSALAVGSIREPGDGGGPAEDLVLDLIMGSGPASNGEPIRCIRLKSGDVLLPQLEGEPSPVRVMQRLVATILKASGATPIPSREDCLGRHGFPAFADMAAYETAVARRLATRT
jgi:hypothetical protein